MLKVFSKFFIWDLKIHQVDSNAAAAEAEHHQFHGISTQTLKTS